MASEAIMILPDGSRKLIRAIELTAEERNNRFLCSGIANNGKLCACRLKPTNATPLQSPYFREYDANAKHQSGCEYCRRRPVTTVEMLDRSGGKTTFGDLYGKLNCDKAPKGKREKGLEEEPFSFEEEFLPQQDTPDNQPKEILQKKRNPRDFRETYELLTSLSTTNRYAGQLVFDVILDDRTVEAYRRLGKIPTVRPFIATLRKAIPRVYGINLAPDEWLLRDCGANNGKEFLFVLKLNSEAKQLVWNLSEISPAVQIRIWSVFHPHPTLPRTYVSELVKPQMIYARVTGDIE